MMKRHGIWIYIIRFQLFIYITSFGIAILINICLVLQAYLYPNLKPNQWFQRWPTEIVSIVDGLYCDVWYIRYPLHVVSVASSRYCDTCSQKTPPPFCTLHTLASNSEQLLYKIIEKVSPPPDTHTHKHTANTHFSPPPPQFALPPLRLPPHRHL